MQGQTVPEKVQSPDCCAPPIYLISTINADEIQSALGCDNLTAARMAENRRETYLKEKKSFCFETVLSTNRNLDLLKRARASGFFIRCYYVITIDPQINAARVLSRVIAGGHDVPLEKIISRCRKAVDLISQLIPICDICHVYDNSLDSPYRIFKKRKESFWYCAEPHLWTKKDIISLTGIKSPIQAALNKH